VDAVNGSATSCDPPGAEVHFTAHAVYAWPGPTWGPARCSTPCGRTRRCERGLRGSGPHQGRPRVRTGPERPSRAAWVAAVRSMVWAQRLWAPSWAASRRSAGLGEAMVALCPLAPLPKTGPRGDTLSGDSHMIEVESRGRARHCRECHWYL